MAIYEGKAAKEYVSPLTSDAGNAFYVVGEIEVTTGVAAGDVLRVLKLPRGAKIMSVGIVATANTGLGGDLVLEQAGTTVGTVSAVGTAGQQLILNGAVECSGGDDVLAINVGTAPTAGGIVRVGVLYTLVNIV